jgi:hypothetical protein
VADKPSEQAEHRETNEGSNNGRANSDRWRWRPFFRSLLCLSPEAEEFYFFIFYFTKKYTIVSKFSKTNPPWATAIAYTTVQTVVGGRLVLLNF